MAKPIDDDTRELVRTAAREAVHEMLIAVGVDASNPAAVIEMQKDFQSLREWRQSLESVKRHGLLTAIGVVVVGILGMIWMNLGAKP